MQVFSRKTKVKHRHFSRKTKVKKYGFGRKTKVLLSSTTALDIAFATLLKNSLSIKLIAPISMNHPRRGGFFFHDFASGECRRRVETKQHKKEPSHGQQEKHHSRHRRNHRFWSYQQPPALARAYTRTRWKAGNPHHRPFSEELLSVAQHLVGLGGFDGLDLENLDAPPPEHSEPFTATEIEDAAAHSLMVTEKYEALYEKAKTTAEKTLWSRVAEKVLRLLLLKNQGKNQGTHPSEKREKLK